MISKKLLSEILGIPVKGEMFITKEDHICFDTDSKNGVVVSYSPATGETTYSAKSVNLHEIAFDKCIEWLWDEGYELWMFRANNIFHVRISSEDVEEKRFYSNPDDKYDAVIQACEFVLKRRDKK